MELTLVGAQLFGTGINSCDIKRMLILNLKMKASFFTIFSLVTVAFFASCSSLKTVKILSQGSVKQKQFEVEIPFEYRLGLIVLKANIQGKEYDFVLDTGAPNVISNKLAKELNLAETTEAKVGDSQGKNSRLKFTTINQIEIGGISFENIGTAIADLDQSNEIACLGVDGFIGANLMSQCVWQFDFDKQIITISDVKNTQRISRQDKVILFRIPFEKSVTGTPLINIKFGVGIVDANVKVDFGSNGLYNSSMNTYKLLNSNHKITNAICSYGAKSAGLYGKGDFDSVQFAMLDSVQINGFNYHEMPVDFSDKGEKTLGLKYFRNFKVTLDWFNSEILFENERPYKKDEVQTYGIQPYFKDNKIFVGFLYDIPMIRQSGIEIGNQILEINGEDLSSVSSEKWCDIINEGLFNTMPDTVSVTILDSDKKELTLLLAQQKLFD